MRSPMPERVSSPAGRKASSWRPAQPARSGSSPRASKATNADARRSQRELDRLVKILLVVAIGLIAITFGLGVVRGNPLGENILAGVSAAIAAIPEEPPILLAVVLGLGAYRLLKRGVLVRHLNAEETLGAVDLILTDKTGTLTENRLAVRGVRTTDGEVLEADRRRDLLLDALRAEDDAWRVADGVRPSSFTAGLLAALAELGVDGLPDTDRLIDSAPADDVQAIHPRPLRGGRRDGSNGGARRARGAPRRRQGARIDGTDPEIEAWPDWQDLVGSGAGAGERLVLLAEGPDEGIGRHRTRPSMDDGSRAPSSPSPIHSARAWPTRSGPSRALASTSWS